MKSILQNFDETDSAVGVAVRSFFLACPVTGHAAKSYEGLGSERRTLRRRPVGGKGGLSHEQAGVGNQGRRVRHVWAGHGAVPNEQVGGL